MKKVRDEEFRFLGKVYLRYREPQQHMPEWGIS